MRRPRDKMLAQGSGGIHTGDHRIGGHQPGKQPRGAGDAGRAPGAHPRYDTYSGPATPATGWALFVGVVLALCVGCARTVHPVLGEAWGPDTAPLRLAAGDSVEIKFYYASELNETQTIRPDGMVSLELVGEVRAAGRTPAELAAHLGKVYATQLINASAAVIVRSFGERRVLVAGAVTKPGPVEMPGRMTVLEAVMLAGGFDTKIAETRSVLVVRRGADGVYRGARFDLKRAIDGTPVPAVHLRPLDIVYVPRTRIVKINQWISQHITGLVPGFGLTYTKRTSDTEVIGVELGGGR